MKKLNMYLMLVVAMALFGIGGAAAVPPEQFGTPDGLPPPMEDICDMESGAAHGLCIAYCEAMDCDSDDPNANKRACKRVHANFEKLTGKIPPCERICPCWERDDLKNVTSENQLPFNSCPGIAIPDLIQNDAFAPGVEGGFGADPIGTFLGQPACFTRDLPPFTLIITGEEADFCAEHISDRCAAIGSPY